VEALAASVCYLSSLGFPTANSSKAELIDLLIESQWFRRVTAIEMRLASKNCSAETLLQIRLLPSF